jgi:hypothetical protein
MYTFRATAKLRTRMGGLITDPRATGIASTTVLGDWTAHIVFWKPQMVLAISQRTRLPVFMRLAPAGTLVTRLPDRLGSVLAKIGIAPQAIAAELTAMANVTLSNSNDRSALGTINRLLFEGELFMPDYAPFEDEDAVDAFSLHVGDTIARGEQGKYLHPHDATRAAFRGEVVRLF